MRMCLKLTASTRIYMHIYIYMYIYVCIYVNMYANTHIQIVTVNLGFQRLSFQINGKDVGGYVEGVSGEVRSCVKETYNTCKRDLYHELKW